MTPEQTARIVKVCERIGWPKSSTYFLVWDKSDCGWYWYGQPSTRQMSCAEDDAEAILEKHFRQWLESKYDRVLIEYTSGLPFKWRIECGMDREMESRVRVAGNDYLDLLLTAVEQTLVQEAKP